MSKVTRRNVLQSGAFLAAGLGSVQTGFRQRGSIFRVRRESPRHPNSFLQFRRFDLSPREHLLFDFDWRFFQGNAVDPEKDLNFGAIREILPRTGDFHFATPKFDGRPMALS